MKKINQTVILFFQLVILSGLLMCVGGGEVNAQYKPDTIYQIYQFPKNMIPRIDGDTSDWAMVPENYVIGTDQLQG